MPEPRKRNRMQPEVRQRILNHYEDSQYVRIMAGGKDFKSMGKGVRMQKRLILCNSKEFFIKYKTDYPDDKVSYSTFCSLRPRYCLFPGVSGTHSICVCVYHQNVKLILSALDTQLSYKEVIPKIVCDVDKRLCMLRLCSECNSLEKISNVVKGIF